MTTAITDRATHARTPARTAVDQLMYLASLPPDDHPIVSCYVRLEPRDRTRQRYLTTFKSRVNDLRPEIERLATNHQIRESVQHDIERIAEHLRRPAHLPRTRGLAIFVSELRGLWIEIPLPYVRRPRVIVDRTAYIREAVAIQEEFGRVLLAAVDRAHARIFELTAFGAKELPSISSPHAVGGRFRNNRGDAPGWGERDYHNRIRTEKERHYQAVVQALADHDRARPADGVVIAAQGPVATAVARFLDPSLQARLLGTTKLNPTALSPAQAHETAMTVWADHSRRQESARVLEVREQFGKRWAVLGVRPTLRALFRGQLREIIVPADGIVAGFRCSDSGELTVTLTGCRGSGVPVPDVLDDAIEEALRQRIRVTVLHDPASAAQIDGLAGTLRFR